LSRLRARDDRGEPIDRLRLVSVLRASVVAPMRRQRHYWDESSHHERGRKLSVTQGGQDETAPICE
jgi:hypothetical protein